MIAMSEANSTISNRDELRASVRKPRDRMRPFATKPAKAKEARRILVLRVRR